MSMQNATDKPSNGRKKNERPTLTPDMALEILRTSLDYVRGSGLTVRIGNRAGLCVIGLAGVTWDSDTHSLCVMPDNDTHGNDTQTPDNVPAQAGESVPASAA